MSENMGRIASIAPIVLGILCSMASSAQAQRRVLVRIEADPSKPVYRFIPANVTARPGDLLVFRAIRGAPHSITFEAGDLSESTHEALNGAMGRRTADLSSPLLTANGAEYRMVVPRVTPGVYQFYCLPHRAYDERGQLRITK